MNKALIDCPAEAGHHNSCDDERKGEVEVAIDQAISTENPGNCSRNRVLTDRSHPRDLQILDFTLNAME